MKQTFTPLSKTNCYEISLYPTEQILQLTWTCTPTVQEYQRGTIYFLELMRHYQAKKLISDCSKRGNPTPPDLLWLSHHVVPALCEERVLQLALVVPHNPHHARNLESCLITSQMCYELQFFHSAQDALDWMRPGPGSFGGRAVA
ncbi:hypothetical protein [Rufibacter psychrotolerans]|uniref:hypothetical protein n=1 Tax=Rufibacter psychrotolerans TaxID=2812556 RepID=UPI0019689C5D|nr:hypothetical protein [Rufibacter sp. SYSU D00308]